MAENEKNTGRPYGIDKLEARVLYDLEDAIKGFTSTCHDGSVGWHVVNMIRDINLDLYLAAATYICLNYDPNASWFGGVIKDAEVDERIRNGHRNLRMWGKNEQTCQVSGFLGSIDKDEPDSLLEDIVLSHTGESYGSERIVDFFEPYGDIDKPIDIGYFETQAKEATRKCGRLTLFAAATYFARRFIRERQKNAEKDRRIAELEKELKELKANK